MSAPTIDVTPEPAVDEQAIASLEAAFAAPAVENPDVARARRARLEQVDVRARLGMGELFVMASFASLAVGFLVLIGLELG